MNPKICIVSATEKEIQPFYAYLQAHAEQHSFQTFQLHHLLIDILYSGIGILQTTYSLMDYLSHRHPDGWLQAGIGGAFDPALTMGNVYQIESEMIVGFGAEQQNGEIQDPFQLGWNDPDAFPFQGSLLPCTYSFKPTLSSARGMTSFHSHGDASRIEILRKTIDGQIENMEGAAFFYISLLKKIPFLSIRSISNFVEPRDTSRWQIKPAIENLNSTLIQWIEENKFNVDKLFGIGGH